VRCHKSWGGEFGVFLSPNPGELFKNTGPSEISKLLLYFNVLHQPPLRGASYREGGKGYTGYSSHLASQGATRCSRQNANLLVKTES